MVTVEDILAHHGVKGMKWGARRAAKKVAKGDKKWQKNIYSVHGAIAVHNAVADKMNNGGLAGLNSKYTGKTVFNHDGSPNGATGKAYMKDYEALTLRTTAAAVKQVHGTSPSGMTAKLDTSGPNWKITVSKGAQHAAGDWEDLEIELEHDASGMIIQASNVKDGMAQSALGREFVEHHGVKGMKWGVRKRSTSSGPATPSAPHHSTLSNEELKKHIERMNLEQRYSALVAPKKDHSESAAFIKGLGKTLVSTAVSAVATQQIGKILKKIP
jgi:hypothetical protein